MSAQSILRQSTRNPRAERERSTFDSREVELVSQGLTVEPDLMHTSVRMKYTVPVNQAQSVIINSPVNWEDRTLHWLELDNSNSNASKIFSFNNDHILLDDPTNTSNSYSILPGKKMSFLGTLLEGKFYWRLSSESTN